MNDFQQLKKSFITLMGGTLISSVLGFISIALVARSLGVTDFGVFALITSYALIIDKLFNFQSWQALIKFGAENVESNDYSENRKVTKLTGFCFSIDLISAVISFLVAVSFANLLIEYFVWGEEAALSLYIISLSCLFKFSSFGIGIFRLFDENKLQSKILSFSALFKTVMVLIAYLLNADIIIYACIWVGSELLLNILNTIYALTLVRKKYQKVELGFNKINSEIIKFVFWTNLSGAVDLPAKELDVLLVGILSNDSQAGLYKLAKQAMIMIGRLAGPLYQAAYPIQAKFVARNEIKDVLKFTTKVSFKSFYFSIAVIVISIIAMEPIINLFLGEAYQELVTLAILAVSLKSIDTNFTLFHSLFIAMGFVKYNVYIILVSNISMVFLFIIAIPKYGAFGALLCLFFQSIMTFSWKLLYINRNHSERI